MKQLPSQVKKYFDGQTVFITGASSGIGKALALELGNCGARVAIAARRKDLLEGVARDIKKSGGEVLSAQADVANRAQIQKAIASARRRFGQVDILIANAGVGGQVKADEFSSSLIENVFKINFMGVVYCIEAVLPQMLEMQSGHIAAVSSLAGWRGMPMHGAYSASKAALSTLLESLRNELRPRGLRVSAISPGFVRTEMTDKSGGAKLPFLIEADDAAQRILIGMARGDSDISFPGPTSAAMKLAKLLPDSVWDSLALRVVSMDPREK